MVGWTIRRPDGTTVDTVFYTEDCDEDYVRRAEEIPVNYTLHPDTPRSSS